MQCEAWSYAYELYHFFSCDCNVPTQGEGRKHEKFYYMYMRHAITSIVPRSSQHPGKTALSEQKLLQAINKAVKTTLKITTKQQLNTITLQIQYN